MDKVGIHELGLLKVISYGSFSEVWECNFNGKKYALKKFYDPDEMINKKFVKRISSISNLALEKSALPISFVYDGKTNLGYLTELLDGEDYIMLNEISKKIKALKDAKSAILELHSNKIIHTDIHGCNIFVLADGSSMLLDFDNISYKKNKPVVENYSDYAKNFVSKYGLSKDLDIYLFNLLTFSTLNNLTRPASMLSIFSGNYGIFKDIESKRICNSLTLENDVFNNEYLIDTLDSESIQKIKII